MTADNTAPFQVMPPLSADEYDALKADIAEHGVVVAVVVDQHGRTIDGHHRKQISAELGIDCPTEVRKLTDDDQARDVAFALNVARRHLTREQKRELIAREIKARPDDSDRAIARRIGCDHKTVGSLRRPSGEIPQSLTREEAEQLTASIKTHLGEARDQVGVLVCRALANNISPAEVVMALTQAQRRFVRDKASNPEIVEVFTAAIFTPLIDAVMDPAEADYWRPHWDHETFEPLTAEERGELLSAIALVGGDDR